MISRLNPALPAAMLEQLGACLGAQALIIDPEELAFFAEDVFSRGQLPLAVIRPTTIERLQAAVKIMADSSVAIIPRGGGMSYTDGYLAVRPNSVIVDLRELNRIVAINAQDMYVTVEAGCTWEKLYSELEPLGLRTPYWGPLSGLRATVGGALSQGSMFLGSGRHGTAADSLLGLEVVVADGSLVKTGSGAGPHAAPFFRYHGPDLTGIFSGDCGVLGLKVTATLKLNRVLPEQRYLSFEFETVVDLLDTMTEVARRDVVSEAVAFDPYLQSLRMQRTSLAADVEALGAVVKADGLKAGARVILGGRKFVRDGSCSAHFSADDRDTASVESRAAAVRDAVGGRGKEVEATVPRVMRAKAFNEVTSILGPRGERWVPIHGIVPLSQAVATYTEIETVFSNHDALCREYGIQHGYLMCTVATGAFLLEPCLYWPDAPTLFHRTVLDKTFMDRLPIHAENLQARAAVGELRRALARRFFELGAVNFQIGKLYPYLEGRDPGNAALLRGLKAQLDPAGLMNPGGLGLD